jgi:Uma2 family endonuclease
MTIAVDRKPMTVEEFMNLPDSQDYELIEGNLVERKKMGARASYIATQIIWTVCAFDKEHTLGWPFDSETVYRCFGRTHTGKRFDFSFIRRGRLIGERIPEADIPIAPDLAVEIVSPNDLAYDVEDKVSLYLSVGVALVWVVYPETRTIQIMRPDGTSTRVLPDQEITGESVLPGFRARVGDFFPPVENVEPVGEAAP